MFIVQVKSYCRIDTWENGLIERTTSLYESSSNMNMFYFFCSTICMFSIMENTQTEDIFMRPFMTHLLYICLDGWMDV